MNMPRRERKIGWLAAIAMVLATSTTVASATTTEGKGYDALPPQVASWAFAAFQGKELALVRYKQEAMPFSGQVLHLIKAATGDKTFLAAVFNAQGQLQVDRGAAMKLAERKARYAIHGALRDDLLAVLPSTPANKPLPVAIWLNVYEPSVPREQLLADDKLAQEYKAVTTWYLDQARAKLLSNWEGVVAAPINFEDGAPLVHTWLTPSQLYSIAKMKGIARVYLDTAPVHTYSTNWDQAVNATSTGVDGSGFEVCILEGARPNLTGHTMAGLPGTNPYHCADGDMSVAARWQAELVASSSSPYGIASGALTSFGNWEGSSCTSYNTSTAINWCSATRAADVWSWPYTCPSATNDLLDYHVKHAPYPTVTVSADNGGASTATTCTGYNVINVGASDHQNTVSRSDDTLWSGTSSASPGGDRQEPMLCAPGIEIQSGSGPQTSSTSASTPMVAGAAAQVLDKNSAFNNWPEGVRAVLLASANENVDGAVLVALGGTNQKDGIGELNVGTAVAIADASNSVDPGNTERAAGFDFGTVSSSDVVESNGIYYMYSMEPFRAKASSGGSWLRVAFVWDGTTTCTSPDDDSTCGSSEMDADFDLWIWHTGMSTWVKSESYDNPWETQAIADPDNDRFDIYVTIFSWGSGITSTYAGLAWNFGDYNN